MLTVAQAHAVLGPQRHSVQRVAVFGTQQEREIIVITRELKLDVVQLHGTATPAMITRVREATGAKIWPVVRIEGQVLPAEAASLAAAAGALVIDSKVVGILGGTGVRLDWSGLRDALDALREGQAAFQLILAGGLRATNVAEAIDLLKPSVVDVSSGVEQAPGVKDPAQVERFVSAATRAAGMQA